MKHHFVGSLQIFLICYTGRLFASSRLGPKDQRPGLRLLRCIMNVSYRFVARLSHIPMKWQFGYGLIFFPAKQEARRSGSPFTMQLKPSDAQGEHPSYARTCPQKLSRPPLKFHCLFQCAAMFTGILIMCAPIPRCKIDTMEQQWRLRRMPKSTPSH
jgi:hypothetical protein